ncbi:DUF1566 domain-containing protein [Colwellia sp. D2M02]|uniref:ankyrin repeat domain-containing protein n=1 Tax=Colwellia sp. D2M02 TaxID=2841562 RepID=UPI001C08889C|nr:ankyrin repeat domain-containing protein [Colwellia sp. D2M02]MBU2894346.1 DUF1566 domain-containing protein [Colwellia sp. D2M02]
MSLRFIIGAIFTCLLFGCGKSDDLDTAAWQDIIAQQSLPAVISEIEQREVLVADEKSALLNAAISHQKIDLIEYLYEQGGLSRDAILRGYKQSPAELKDTWQYLLNYNKLKYLGSNSPLPRSRQNYNYFPDLVLRFRLFSEPGSIHYSEYQMRSLLSDIGDDLGSEDGDPFTSEVAIFKAQFHHYYDVENTAYVKFMLALFDIKFLRNISGPDIDIAKKKAYQTIKVLSNTDYSPAIFYVADNMRKFYPELSGDDRFLQKKSLLERAAKLGDKEAQSALLNLFDDMLGGQSYEIRYGYAKQFHNVRAYKELIIDLLYSTAESTYNGNDASDTEKRIKTFKAKAAPLFLEATKAGFFIEHLGVRDIKELSINSQLDFLEGFLIQGSYDKAKELALLLLPSTSTQKNLKRLIPLIINNSLINDAAVMKTVIDTVNLAEYLNNISQLNSEITINGSSLLTYLISKEQIELAQQLIESDVNMQEQNFAYTSLYTAIEIENDALIKELLTRAEMPIYLKRYGYQEQSLLHLAVSLANFSLVKQLTSKGADIAAKDRNDLTALDWAISLKLTDIANYLAQQMNVDISQRLHAKPKDCIVDSKSQLTWLNKEATGDSLFSWKSKVTLNEPDNCQYEACSLSAVIKRLNDIKYCQRNDWRVPSAKEMQSLSDEVLSALKGKPAAYYFVQNKSGNLGLLNIDRFGNGRISINTYQAHIWPVAGKAKKLTRNLTAHQFSLGGPPVVVAADLSDEAIKSRTDEENYQLAYQLYFGQVQKRSTKKALALFDYLKVKQHAGAHAFLSYHYEEKNKPQLSFQFAMSAVAAAKNEHWQGGAKARLGRAYILAIGTPQDAVRGVALLKEAIALNNVDAMATLAKYYQDNNKVTEHYTYRKMAAAKNHAESQRILAVMYDFGYGLSIKKDTKKALSWFREASKNGDILATRRLIRAYKRQELGLTFSQPDIDILNKRLGK